MQKNIFLVSACLALLIGLPLYARHFSTSFAPGKCMDVVNDGQNRNLRMTGCANYTGQNWNYTETGSPGFYKMGTDFTGPGRCLQPAGDLVNLEMVNCQNISGQSWKIFRYGNGYHIENMWQSGKCIDVDLKLRACANISGQEWQIQ